ncbi:hypothetical protein OIO90_004654 [Microbotryomycetes sp. JL221]|nr:hypothetical protein OIO90_004654 [Microbotryomycetes sp. JL221]
MFTAGRSLDRQKLVILGSGWGGYELLRKVDKSAYDVTMVSQNTYFAFTPLLASAAVGTVEFRATLEPVRRFARNTTSYQAWADAVDFDKKVIQCLPAVGSSTASKKIHEVAEAVHSNENVPVSSYPGVKPFTLQYDKLVIAVGAYSQTFGTPGVKEYAHFLKDVKDSRRIRSRILECFELAAQPTLTDEQRIALLSFRIVGGGPTGIEFAAELHDLIVTDMTKVYPRLAPMATITIYDVAPTILGAFDKELVDYAMQEFKRQGITIKNNRHVVEVKQSSLVLKEEGEVPFGMLVWSTGLAPNPLVESIKELEHDPKTQSLKVDGHFNPRFANGKVCKDVFVIGDAAKVDGDPLPATAQVANQEAKHLAKILNSQVVSWKSDPGDFAFKNKGIMTYIGDWRGLLDASQAKSGPKAKEGGRVACVLTPPGAALATAAGRYIWDGASETCSERVDEVVDLSRADSNMTANTVSPTPTLHDSDGLAKEASTQIASNSKVEETAPVKKQGPDESMILQGTKLAVVFGSLLLSILLIALEYVMSSLDHVFCSQTILATALPRIASDFNAFTLQGWVSSAFILTQTGFILIYGPVLRIFSAKWVLLSAVIIFEVGSAICGAAPDVYVLIFGRALSGVGAAGVFTSAIQILGQCTRLQDRPKLFSMFGAVFALSSVIGPVSGGGLTDNVSWRWCFYINLPVGGVTLAVIFFTLKATPPLGADLTKRSPKDLFHQCLQIDWIGSFLILAAVTCLVLALQWGGNTKPWKSAAVLVPLILSIITGFVLIGWQKYLGDKAMVPPKVIKNWSVIMITIYSFAIRFVMLVDIYYLPIFYQVTRQASATKSSLDILALMLSIVLSVIIAGQIVGRVLYRFWPFLVAGPVFLAIGSGLLYTIDETTSAAKIIGYQILTGVGIGSVMQNSLLAMQVEFRDTPKLLAQGTGLASFSQFLGGTIGLAVAQAVFAGVLGEKMRQFAPNAPIAIVKQDPLSIYDLPVDQIDPVIKAYVRTLKYVFILGVPFAIVAQITSFFISNSRITPPAAASGADKKQSPRDEEKNVTEAESEVVAGEAAVPPSKVVTIPSRAESAESKSVDGKV